MSTIRYIIQRSKAVFFAPLAFIILLASCVVEDPFVDRTVAPVLIVFDEVTGYLASGGITSIPSVTKVVTAATYTNPVILSISVYELDKSGILDHTVGIDSIPVTNLAITFSKRDGTSPLIVTSDASGKVVVSTTWEDLGVTDVATIVGASPSRSISIPLLWSGTYNGQSFARYSQVVFSKPAS